MAGGYPAPAPFSTICSLYVLIDATLSADVEGDRVRLSANADVAVTFEEEA